MPVITGPLDIYVLMWLCAILGWAIGGVWGYVRHHTQTPTAVEQ